MYNDLRYALRQLRKDPGFTAVAVLSLALGIGANTAIFGLIDAVLLKSMPVKDPKELVQVIRIHPRWGVSSLSYPAFEQFRDHNRTFTGVFAVTGIRGMTIHLNGQTEQVDGQFVSGAFYSVLGVGAIHGRTFTADDDPDTLFPSVPHGFSQVIATHGGKTIYISGQTAWDAEKRLVGGNSLEAQAKQALQNVRHVVEAAGGSLADVVALRLYVVNYRPADANSLGGVLREFSREFSPGVHPRTSSISDKCRTRMLRHTAPPACFVW